MQGNNGSFTIEEIRGLVAMTGIIGVCLLAYDLRNGLVLFGLIAVGFIVERIHEPVIKDDGDDYDVRELGNG